MEGKLTGLIKPIFSITRTSVIWVLRTSNETNETAEEKQKRSKKRVLHL